MSTDPDIEAVTFWEGWHRHAKEPVGPLTHNQASQQERNQKPYVAVLGDPMRPRCFIEINNDFFGVSFLDEDSQEHLMYSFEEIEEGKLFLSEALYREYDDETGSVLSGTIYRFLPDGRTSVERQESRTNQITVSDRETDVSSNWEPRPALGDYVSITREER